MRLARALVAEHRHDFRVRRRVVAVQIDDRVKQVALGREQLGDVVAGADLVVRVAGEVVAERVAGALQDLAEAVGEWSFGDSRESLANLRIQPRGEA